MWHETTLVAGTDPMQRVFNASAQANTLERAVIVLQMDISEVKRLQRDIRIAVSTCGRRAGMSGGLTDSKKSTRRTSPRGSSSARPCASCSSP